MPCLYSLTLQHTSAITQGVIGSFSQPKIQEIAVSKGKILSLLKVDELTGRLIHICSTEVFGLIRSLCVFRLTGCTQDFLVVGSDSGRIVILEFDAANHKWNKVHQETFGKTGCRRIVPGQYLAVDPKGRALMIGAIEKQKFVYVLNRDASNRLTISSPLEGHKSHQLCFALTGVDVGYENPIFASIEQSYEASDKPPKRKPGTNEFEEPAPIAPKGLAFWEMDLGLNHVIKKATMALDDSAHMVIPVPAGSASFAGPSGVLVCCENYLVYKKPGHDDVVCAIPRRLEMQQEKGLMVVCYAAHRLREMFFFLIQSEYGDLYRVDISHAEGEVSEVTCRYFDSIPVANSLCVLKAGYLFAVSEFGNHGLYQFVGLGNEETDPCCSSLHPHGGKAIVAFKPRNLANLICVDTLSSMSPTIDLRVFDCMGQGAPQIYAACGRGPQASLRVLQHGHMIEEITSNELPGKPRSIWTVKANLGSPHDSHIVVGFPDSTLVLSIGETVEEVSDSPFVTDTLTLFVGRMDDGSIVQVFEAGVRHVNLQTDGTYKANEWRAPPGKRTIHAFGNGRQLALALGGGSVIVFELDELGVLTELGKKELGHEITCVSLSPVPSGRTRAKFVAVGGLDSTVRILSLEREKGLLRQLSVQALFGGAQAESCVLTHIHMDVGRTAAGGSASSTSSLFLFVGLETGVLLRSTVNPSNGQLSDQRTKFLGARAVRLFPISIDASSQSASSEPAQSQALMALSTKPWILYGHQGRFVSIPLHCNMLNFISPFNSAQCTDGFIAISTKSLRIFQLSSRLRGEVFCQKSYPLSYTPRKLVILPPPPTPQEDGSLCPQAIEPTFERPLMMAIIEADHNSYDEGTKTEIRNALRNINLSSDPANEETGETSDPPEEQIGTFKAGAAKWGSCLRIMNPSTGETVEKISFTDNEAAISAVVCYFLEFPEQPCLVVGTVIDMGLRPRVVPVASVKVYAFNAEYKLTLLHSTLIEDAPMALFPFNGRILISVGNRIRLCALGKKKLLKKCEYRNLPEAITWLRVSGERIFAGDVRENFHVLCYKETENIFQVVADSTSPAWLTCGELLDPFTVMGADKFDSVFVSRLPHRSAVDERGDITGLKLRGDTAYLTGHCPKLERVNMFHVGETVTALQKTVLCQGGSEIVLSSSIMGSIGAFLPLATKDEVEFFQQLEMIMRTEAPPLCGMDHLVFRSFYAPVKGVIDGDLCEQFTTLPPARQREISSQLDRSVAEIAKRLEETRNRIL